MYILNQKRQLERISEMVTVRKDMDTFEVFYHDPSTGELWKSFYPKGYKRNESPKLLRPEPLPDKLELQLEICLNSTDETDAIGLGIECSVKPQYWSELLEILDQNRKKYLRSHLSTFIKHLGIMHPQKSLEEAQIDPKEYGLDQDALHQFKKKARRIKIKRFFHL